MGSHVIELLLPLDAVAFEIYNGVCLPKYRTAGPE
jgi:hypothetical protein